jgi:hypothetical protein
VLHLRLAQEVVEPASRRVVVFEVGEAVPVRVDRVHDGREQALSFGRCGCGEAVAIAVLRRVVLDVAVHVEDPVPGRIEEIGDRKPAPAEPQRRERRRGQQQPQVGAPAHAAAADSRRE